MFNRRIGLLNVMAAAAVGIGLNLAHFLPTGPMIPEPSGSPRRGKRQQSKPKKRSNRLIISKRVRRKHRRAA